MGTFRSPCFLRSKSPVPSSRTDRDVKSPRNSHYINTLFPTHIMF